MKLLLCCTKAKPYLRDYRGKAIYNRFVISPSDRPFTSDDTQPILNGKVVIECDYKVEKIYEENGANNFFYTKSLDNSKLEEKSCLNLTQLKEYLFKNTLIDKDAKGLEMFYKGYTIHVKNLTIFDEPKELECYDKINKKDCFEVLHNAPQSMIKVVNRDDVHNEYILISVSTEEMCRIANKEQDVLVRKRVSKEMLK